MKTNEMKDTRFIQDFLHTYLLDGARICNGRLTPLDVLVVVFLFVDKDVDDDDFVDVND